MTRAQQLALLLTLAVLAVAVVSGSGGWWGTGDVVTDRYTAPLGGAKSLEATVFQRAGTLRIETIATDSAYEATLTRHARIGVRVDYQNGRLRISDRRSPAGGRRYTNEWVVRITRRVPVDLEVSSGAGRAVLDLTGLRGEAKIQAGAGETQVAFREGPGALEELHLQAGAGRFEAAGLGNARARHLTVRAGVGEFHLDFSGAARGLTQAEITGGVGRIVVVVPEGLGVRVLGRSGPTSRLHLGGFTQRGPQEYVNAAWETAPAKLELRVRLGVGEFEVRGRM